MLAGRGMVTGAGPVAAVVAVVVGLVVVGAGLVAAGAGR